MEPSQGLVDTTFHPHRVHHSPQLPLHLVHNASSSVFYLFVQTSVAFTLVGFFLHFHTLPPQTNKYGVHNQKKYTPRKRENKGSKEYQPWHRHCASGIVLSALPDNSFNLCSQSARWVLLLPRFYSLFFRKEEKEERRVGSSSGTIDGAGRLRHSLQSPQISCHWSLKLFANNWVTALGDTEMNHPGLLH